MPAPNDKIRSNETLKIVLRGPDGQVKAVQDVEPSKKDRKNG